MVHRRASGIGDLFASVVRRAHDSITQSPQTLGRGLLAPLDDAARQTRSPIASTVWPRCFARVVDLVSNPRAVGVVRSFVFVGAGVGHDAVSL